jgi:Ni,Fe-hydrogenase III small subunit/ferredoxin
MSWIVRGLRRGILTTSYPRRPDAMPQAYRGEAIGLDATRAEQERGAEACPTRAIEPRDSRARVDRLRCIQCGLCAIAAPAAFAMCETFELAELGDDVAATKERIRDAVRALGRSVHLRHVDTGSDGSEEQELTAIFNPFYDAQRLGIFLTAAPRHADVLVVTGPVTRAMAGPLQRAYEAMPFPKLVVALGATACSGGIFRERGIAGPVSRVLPVDVFVPGSPPSPLTILHGLLVALGRLHAAERAI